MPMVRFSVSLEKQLLDDLDQYVRDNSFANRSQALRFIIEKGIVDRKWHCNNIVAGVVVLIYNPHKKGILNMINNVKHLYLDSILSSQQFHLEHERCMDITTVRGEAKRLTGLSDKLISIKGVKHGKLVMSKAD